MNFEDGFKAGFQLGQKAGAKGALTGGVGYLLMLLAVVGWSGFCLGKQMSGQW